MSQALEENPREQLRQVVREQLRLLLAERNFEGVKTLLTPVQAIDIAEAIEGLPQRSRLEAFRLLAKETAVEVYENFATET